MTLIMKGRGAVWLSVPAPLLLCLLGACRPISGDHQTLHAGAAAVTITPFGQNPEWDGPITASGVWGEKFEDKNNNARWDIGEPFTDDDGNTALAAHSRWNYDCIHLASFGPTRTTTGIHADWRTPALVPAGASTRLTIASVEPTRYYSHAGC